LLSTATGKAHQFRSLLGRTRQRHRDPGHTTPQLVCRPEVSYKILNFNAIKHQLVVVAMKVVHPG
jgi:hypothetical protein